KPHKIRLLRKAGRTAEAQTLTVDCALNGTTELKKACEAANQTPAGRAPAPREGVSCEATPEGSPRGVLPYVERLPRASTKQLAPSRARRPALRVEVQHHRRMVAGAASRARAVAAAPVVAKAMQAVAQMSVEEGLVDPEAVAAVR